MITMRMSLKSVKSRRKKRRLFWLSILVLLLLIIFYISKMLGNLFLEYAKTEAFRYATLVINNSVTDELLAKTDEMELFNITKNAQGEIEMVDYDSLYVNLFLKEVTSQLEQDMLAIGNGDLSIIGRDSNKNGAFFTISLGEVLQNPLFNYLGPKVDVHIKLIGAIETNVYTVVKEYGINNSLIEMGVNITVSIRVMLPVITDTITVNNQVPISYKIVTGQVPSYYGGSMNQNSDIFSIPIE